MADHSDLKFTKDHEWVRLETSAEGASVATIGITAYAAEKLGDVVYVDLPDAGVTLAGGAIVGEIESTKSVGELFAPIDGTVLEKNSAVEDSPELVNSDPFGEGWLIRVELPGAGEPEALPDLLSYTEYQALLAEEDSAHS